jgi:hypothetical protein
MVNMGMGKQNNSFVVIEFPGSLSYNISISARINNIKLTAFRDRDQITVNAQPPDYFNRKIRHIPNSLLISASAEDAQQ